MASALTPAQKAALTKQVKRSAVKQGEQIVEGGAALVSLAHKSTADAIAEMLKQKEYGFCLLLKELIANGSLEQVLMVTEEGEAGDKIAYIRQGCVRWRALPVKYQEMLMQALAPAVALMGQQNGGDGFDLLELLMHALHVGPESYLPHRWRKEAVALPVLTEVCKERYEQMGRRLDDIGVDGLSVKYWRLEDSPARLIFQIKESTLEIPLPFQELPQDAQVIDEKRMSAKLRVKSKLIDMPCLELALESEGVQQSALHAFLVDEEAEWSMTRETEQHEDEMCRTPAAASLSEAQTSAASTMSGVKRPRPKSAAAVARKKSFTDDVFASLQGDGSSRSSRR
eukprot:6490665-Amphidinium_carterae.2